MARRSFRVWLLCSAVVMLAGALFASGVLSVARRSKMATNYRSDVGAQEPRKIIFLDGVSIAYTDTGGNDPVLLCLHAIGHGARDFENLSRRLDQQYRVIALDFPGQGNSGSDGQPASGSRYTRLVSQFIEQLNLNSITLLGNSIGGAVSVRYASLHPERVKALVLCDSGGLGAPGAVGGVFIKTFVQFFAAGRRGASWFPWAFDKYYRRVLRTQSAQQERHRIIRSAYEIAPVLEQAWRSFERPEENLGPILPQIRCPVLLAWAKDDFVIPLKLSAPALERFPNHRLEVFTGGHAAFLEDPDRFEQVLRRFLADVNTAPVRDSAESEEKGR